MDVLQQRLAQYAGGLSAGAMAPRTLHEACVRVIDTLGALLGGFDDEPNRIARALAVDMPLAGGATVLGTALQVPADIAAFVNGTATRSAEINDVYHRPGSKNGHPSDVIAPLFAVAQTTRANGRDFLAAVVIAYEIYLQFADHFHNRSFDASNFCTIAVAAAAARLLGLPAAWIAEAISIAAVPNNALNQSRTGHLTMWKSAAAGQAGRAGVFAALLAGKGMRGAHEPFSGKHGWCNHVAQGAVALGALGNDDSVPFKIHESIIKPRMACLHTLAPILAAEKAAARLGGQLGDVARVRVEVYRANERALASVEKTEVDHHWHPDSRETADHSIPYCVAATLLDGSVSPRSFDSAHLSSPALRALLDKTELAENSLFTAAYEKLPVQYRCRVTASLHSGAAIVGETGAEHGDLSDPKSDDQIAAKFRSFAEDRLGASRTEATLEKLWALAALENVAALPAWFLIVGNAA